jgi:hypothetical protein
MDYISRKLRLFEGPEGITLELVQWGDSNACGQGLQRATGHAKS